MEKQTNNEEKNSSNDWVNKAIKKEIENLKYEIKENNKVIIKWESKIKTIKENALKKVENEINFIKEHQLKKEKKQRKFNKGLLKSYEKMRDKK